MPCPMAAPSRFAPGATEDKCSLPSATRGWESAMRCGTGCSSRFSRPRASGEDVARAALRLAPATPVVLLTGWADQLQAQCESPEGVARVLGKPITLADLATTLGTLCPR